MSGAGGSVGWSLERSKSKSSSGKMMEGYFNNLMGDMAPANDQIMQQFLAMLTSGQTPTASSPMLQGVLNSSKAASAQANKQTEQSVAKSGLAGTPFGELVKAQTYQTGAQQNVDATTGAMNQIMQQFMQYLANMQGGAVSGLAGVSPGTTSGYATGLNVKGSYGGK